jgi:peptidoglycan-N-acetylglucosamine deacetylase
VARCACWALLGILAVAAAARADIVTRLPTRARVIALSFDACQAGTTMRLDHGIADYLVGHRIPFTVFMGGRFARDNAQDVAALAGNPFVEIENHSWSHNNEMPTLSDERVTSEVTRAENQIRLRTARRTRLFRFPAGNSDQRTVGLVESLGYTVVHWRWSEGDPDPKVSADDLVRNTLERARPGDILVFHINGRGVHTAEALPRIVDGLTVKGYRFVRIDEFVHGPAAAAPAAPAAPAAQPAPAH